MYGSCGNVSIYTRNLGSRRFLLDWPVRSMILDTCLELRSSRNKALKAPVQGPCNTQQYKSKAWIIISFHDDSEARKIRHWTTQSLVPVKDGSPNSIFKISLNTLFSITHTSIILMTITLSIYFNEKATNAYTFPLTH